VKFLLWVDVCLSDSVKIVLFGSCLFSAALSLWQVCIFKGMVPDLRVNSLRAHGKHQVFVQVKRIGKQHGKSLCSRKS